MSPEEEERRRVRRERNKEAAAKCRQKRVDLTNQLLSVSGLLFDLYMCCPRSPVARPLGRHVQ